jgi:hypothetical protein
MKTITALASTSLVGPIERTISAVNFPPKDAPITALIPSRP